jgi:hypothetical protein
MYLRSISVIANITNGARMAAPPVVIVGADVGISVCNFMIMNIISYDHTKTHLWENQHKKS